METLEGRALLSQLAPGLAAHRVHAEVARVSDSGLRLGPILERTGPGYVVKGPRFAQTFTGVPRSELNAAGLKAAFDGRGNLVLTGIVTATDIPQIAADSTQESSYIFGIDRGSASYPGPIYGRPQLTFDAVVVVSISQSGASASVEDLVTGTSTPLSASSLLFKQNALQVTVPVSTLAPNPPVSGTTPIGYTANFWTANAVNSGTFQDIASFAPEYHNIVIATSHATIRPARHFARRA